MGNPQKIAAKDNEEDEIKKLGGYWDANIKKWFIYSNNKNLENILNLFKRIDSNL